MAVRTLRHDILNMGTANAIEFALNFVTPVVIARCLTIEDFAGYRMVWLIVATLLAFATLKIPQNLSYFLPRMEREERAPYILGAIYILTATAALSAVTVNPWLPLFPTEWIAINGPTWFYSVFIFLWVIGATMDWLAVGDERAVWQARIKLSLAVTRITTVSLVAWITGALEPILYTLLLLATLKVAVLVFYINKFHGWKARFPRMQIVEEFKYSWTFGLASGLFGFRGKIEMWMVAALFAAKDFAIFSLGTVASPLFMIIRTTTYNVVFPALSAMKHKDDRNGIVHLWRKATSTVSFLIFPTVVFFWTYAHEIISLVYTEKYAAGGDVMRVYLLGVIPQLSESAALLRLSAQGKFQFKIDLFMLPVVALFSFAGVQIAGLPGAAAGSVTALYIGHFLCVRLGAAKLEIPATELYDFRYLGWVFAVGTISAVITEFIVLQTGVRGGISEIALGGLIMGCIYLSIMQTFRKIPVPVANLLKRRKRAKLASRGA